MVRALNEELNYIAQGAMQTRAIPGLPEGFITNRYLNIKRHPVIAFANVLTYAANIMPNTFPNQRKEDGEWNFS